MSGFVSQLTAIAAQGGIALADRVGQACEAHFALMLKWNAAHNLTRITDPTEAARRHYLDCLVPLLALPPPPSFADVGSGAGFPGLLAALVWPDSQGILVEPARKRASFLMLAAKAMGVSVSVVPPKAAEARAALVLSRATFSPGKRGELREAAAPGARIAVWGHEADRDAWRAEVASWGWAESALPYRVPGVEDRCLLMAESRGVSRGTDL